VTTAVGLLNVALGTVYFSYGLMTVVDLKRGWRANGFSHFGFAWLAMAFTCGPHHLDHGAHILLADRSGGALDLVTIAVGAPAGVIWFLLRAEAMLGGRGDRSIRGTPLWIDLLPLAGIVYGGVLLAAALDVRIGTASFEPRSVPNLLLLVLYAAIGVQLARTQVGNRPHAGGWSLSGTALAMVMLTCALMHGVYALYATTGRYDLDAHGQVIDTLSVPAAAYFLWVVAALHRGRLRDWNESDHVEPGRRASTGAPSDALVTAR
jgi:hypothetical protein